MQFEERLVVKENYKKKNCGNRRVVPNRFGYKGGRK